jgi:hypothetical protein
MSVCPVLALHVPEISETPHVAMAAPPIRMMKTRLRT